jgi:hypothetical protein
MQAGPALSVIPPDVLVTRLDLPSRGSKAQGRQKSPISAPNQVAHLGSAQGAVTQVMIALDQFIPQARNPAVLHPLEDQRLEGLGPFPHGLSGVGSRAQLEAPLTSAVLPQGFGQLD